MPHPTSFVLNRSVFSPSIRRANTRACLRYYYSTSPPSGSSTSFDSASSIKPSAPQRSIAPIVPIGLIPAYDEAIVFLQQNSLQLRQKLKQLQLELRANPEDEFLKKSVSKLEIESLINDPSVRARHKAGLGDMSQAVYRHLKEKDWRETGRLGRVMETAHSLRIFPDILPAMAPTADLQAIFQRSPIGMGSFLSTSKSVTAPRVRVQVFHAEQQLYTLMMIDPDVPDPSNQSFTTYLHWLVPNIPISANQNGPLELPTDEATHPILPYVPPHPARGSPLHRYTLLLLKQSSKLENLHPVFRLRFSARRWATATQMEGVGVLSWTSKWREQEAGVITQIYTDHLKCPEPLYGRSPKSPSGRTRLPPRTPLPLTHRHPPVIPWQKHSNPTSGT